MGLARNIGSHLMHAHLQQNSPHCLAGDMLLTERETYKIPTAEIRQTKPENAQPKML